MGPEQREEIAAVLKQRLETELLLGAREIPVSVDAVGERTSSVQVQNSEEQAERKARELRLLDEQQVCGCVKCALSRTRTQTVFGQGRPSARIMFVGEAPGFEEDRQGLAFVGRAGQLLTRMIAAMGLDREDVFICNVLKCRPPNNRAPATDEIASCSPYLIEQIRIIEPEVIVALGAPASQTLLDTRESIGRLRGQFHDFYASGTPMIGDPIPVMPTYHPAYLLRNAQEKPRAWEDLKLVMRRLGLPIPERHR